MKELDEKRLLVSGQGIVGKFSDHHVLMWKPRTKMTDKCAILNLLLNKLNPVVWGDVIYLQYSKIISTCIVQKVKKKHKSVLNNAKIIS